MNTPRLFLRLPVESDSVTLEAFEKRNAQHLSPWRSIHGESNIDWKNRIAKWAKEFEENQSIRFLLFLRENSKCDIIGLCNFSQIVRGPFQACYLGYQIDVNYESQGLMSEAVKAAIGYMFSKQNIHRIMANYIPSNMRSAKLLKNLGFTIEGLAKKYLLINGQWEDHVLTSLTNQECILH